MNIPRTDLLPNSVPAVVTEPGAAMVTVRSCKFDGSLHRSWPASLVEITDELIVLDGAFESDVQHELLGKIERGTRTREYFWLHRWYSLYQFFGRGDEMTFQYVNINLPPTLSGTELTFIDLDIDILVKADGAFSVLDEDEFRTNAERFQYPAEIRAGVRRTLADLSDQIRSGRFPAPDPNPAAGAN